jgi:hypothetical protein
MKRDTLAGALFRCGQFEEALAEERRAGAELSPNSGISSLARWTRPRFAAQAWRPRASEASGPSACVHLGRKVNERRTFTFDDAQDRWWYAQLAGLVPA